MSSSSWQQEVAESVAAVRALAPTFRPEVGIVFGTGLSRLSTEVEEAITIPYSAIPHFAVPTA